MRISIIIPAAGSPEELKRCLSPILAFHQKPEIIVIDDSPGQDLAACAREYSRGIVNVAANGANRGASYSRNRGVALSHSEYLLFVDSDCVLGSDFLTQLECAESVLARSDVGGLSFTVMGPRGVFSQGISTDFFFRTHNLRGLPPQISEVECLNTCCCLMKRSLFSQRGFLEHYKYIFEDVEFSLYAREQGARFYYFPRCRAYHFGNSYAATNAQRMFYSYRNRLYTILARRPKQRAAILCCSLGYEFLRTLKLFLLDPGLCSQAFRDLSHWKEHHTCYR